MFRLNIHSLMMFLLPMLVSCPMIYAQTAPETVQLATGAIVEVTTFHGIGTSVDWDTENNLGVLVVATLPRTPAEKAGIQMGDIITAVDGEALAELSGVYSEKLEKAINLIKGEQGTSVILTIKRPGKEDPLEIKVQRAPINPGLEISKEMLDPEIGRIILYRFYENASSDVLDSLHFLHKNGMKKLILDLRYNPGGDLTEAVKTVGLFLKKGQPLVTTRIDEAPSFQHVNESV